MNWPGLAWTVIALVGLLSMLVLLGEALQNIRRVRTTLPDDLRRTIVRRDVVLRIVDVLVQLCLLMIGVITFFQWTVFGQLWLGVALFFVINVLLVSMGLFRLALLRRMVRRLTLFERLFRRLRRSRQRTAKNGEQVG